MKRIFYTQLVLSVLVFMTGRLFAQDDLQFTTDFPGGNILIDRISNDTVYVKPDLRDTEGDWFYWYFGVKGAAERSLTFQFGDIRKMAAYGPAVSTDGGRTWKWLYQEPGVRKGFSYAFPPGVREARFSTGIPYLQADLDAFLAKHQGNPSLQVDTLCMTAKGRAVERITLAPRGKDPRYKVLITARHHACEMMASYELEGIMDAILSEHENMDWLRENVEFMIIPFMDKDGVEDGDQGKNRNGRDHNRDYAGESIYASTAALRNEIPEWSENKLRIALDLHCPYINATTASRNATIFMVGSGQAPIEREQKRFLEILETHKKGVLSFRTANSFMSYGTDWNSDAGSGQGERFTFTRWASTLDDIALVATIEFPYAINDGQMITPENARGFGKDVAHAMARYLQQ